MTRSRSQLVLAVAALLVSGCHPSEPRPARSVPLRARPTDYRFHAAPTVPDTCGARNPAHDFELRVSPAGLEVSPSSAGSSGEDWHLRLGTRSFGRSGFTQLLSSPRLGVQESRATLTSSALEEWFLNQDLGVEQGWTIQTRPAGDQPLWIGLEFQGLSLRIDDGAHSAVLVDHTGEPRLRYRDLTAFDATGRTLTALLESSPSGPGIRIDDRAAQYPITVDPLLVGPVWKDDGDQAGAEYGISSAAGDFNGRDIDRNQFSDLAVGSHVFNSNQGQVRVFHGSKSGLHLVPDLILDGPSTGAMFGYSVAALDVNGDNYSDLAVGARRYSTGSLTWAGRVYVYLGSASGLSSTAAWSVEGDQSNAEYGTSVASAGDVNGDNYADLLIGAPGYNGSEGKAELYLGSSSGLSLTPSWTYLGTANDWLGAPVATAGDVDANGYADILVSTYLHGGGVGRVYLFLGSSTGMPATPSWMADGPAGSGRFGYAAACAGDVNGDNYSDVLIGAPLFTNVEPNEGAAFLYFGSSTGLSPTASWSSESNLTNSQYGFAVSTAGITKTAITAGDIKSYSAILIGAEGDIGPEPQYIGRGQAHVYEGSDSGPGAEIWTDRGPAADSRFGEWVCYAGDTNGDGYGEIAVSATLFDGDVTNEGQVYVYHLVAGGLALEPSWTVEESEPARYGYALSGTGDYNGDGRSDLLVGEEVYSNNGFPGSGRVLLYLNYPAANPTWTDAGHQVGDNDGQDVRLGSSVAFSDVNGDGFDDAIVGAPLLDNGDTNEGAVMVYLGTDQSLGDDATPDWSAEGNAGNMVFGTRLAGGDLNADGYGDIAVSAPGYNNFQGQVRIYYGSATGLPALADLTLFGDANASTCQNGERFGMSLAIADFHHDGNEDLAVGADWFGDCRGRVYLFLGAPSPAGVSSTPAMQLLGQQDAAWFGNAISNAGDVNGDGYADLIVGSPMHTNGVGHASEGLVSLFSGSISGLNTSPSWTYENDQNASNLGLAVSTAGDLDADGYSDVVCGAPFYDGTETDEGRAYAFLGSASGLSDYPAWLSDGDQASAHYGTAVSFLKDTIVGSDEVSFGAILVGAPDFNSAVDTSPFEEGRAFAYAGNAQGVSFSLPEQFRVSGGTLPLGETSDFNGGFRAGMQADNDFAGMAWAKPCLPMSWMEWEVARLGGTFDGNPDDQTDGQSVSGDPVTFMPLILGLEPGTPYIWRARISTNYALFPNTPWLTVQGRPPKELKFFTPDGGGSTRPSGPP